LSRSVLVRPRHELFRYNRRSRLSTSSDAIIAADKEGIIRFWNPGAERIFGYASAAAVGRSLDIIIPERLRKRHWDGYYRVIKSGESRYGYGDILSIPGVKGRSQSLYRVHDCATAG
jgi:PAS domain-containing protein